VRLAYQTALEARQALRGQIATLAKHKKGAARQQLQEARDLLLALYGVRLDDATARARDEKRSWYVVDPKMTRARALTLEPLLRDLEARLGAGAR